MLGEQRLGGRLQGLGMKEKGFSSGKLIKSVRTALEISQEALVAGLCSTSTLGTYERGEKEPGKWVFDVCMERMGQVPKRFSSLYDGQELGEAIYRDLLLYLLREGDGELFLVYWQEAWEELNRSTEKRDLSKACQEQFLRYVRLLTEYIEQAAFDGIALEQKAMVQKPDWEKRASEIQTALWLTLPETAFWQAEGYRLGRIELALKAMQADHFCKREKIREQGFCLYRQLLKQTEEQILDPEALSDSYSCLAALFLRRLAEVERWGEEAVCRNWWKLIRRDQKLYGMEVLLQYELEKGKRQKEGKDKDVADGIRKREDVLELLFLLEEWSIKETEGQEGKPKERRELNQKKQQKQREVGTDWDRNTLAAFLELGKSSFRGLPLGESVRMIREEKKLSQKKLSERIDITVKTIRRLEQGRVESNSYTYQKILKELGWEERGCRYYTDIKSDRYEVHQRYQKIRTLISYWKYEEAEQEMEEFRYELSQKDPVNRQGMLLQTILDGELHKASAEEQLRCFKEALALTIPEGVSLERWPLKYQEIVLLNNIANEMEALGDFRGAEELLNQIVTNCERNPVGAEKNDPQYLMTLFNLERYLGKQEKHKEAIEVSKKGLLTAYKVKSGSAVVEFLYKLVWNREQIYDLEVKRQEQEGRPEEAEKIQEEKEKICLPICRQIFELAEMLDYDFYVKHLSKHCRKEYKVEISSSLS